MSVRAGRQGIGIGGLDVVVGERVVVNESAQEIAGVGVDAYIGELLDAGGAVGGGVSCVGISRLSCRFSTGMRRVMSGD